MALYGDTHYFCLNTRSDWSHNRDGEEASGREGAGCPCSLSLILSFCPRPPMLLWEAAGRRQSTQPIPGCHLSAPDQSHVRSCVPDQSGASTPLGRPEVLGWGRSHVGCRVWRWKSRLRAGWFGHPVSDSVKGSANQAWLCKWVRTVTGRGVPEVSDYSDLQPLNKRASDCGVAIESET